MRCETHYSGQVTLELLDDTRETAAGEVKELPAPAHRLPVPSRGGMFGGLRDVAFGLVPELVLEEDAKLEGVSDEEGEHRRDAHGDGGGYSTGGVEAEAEGGWKRRARAETVVARDALARHVLLLSRRARPAPRPSVVPLRNARDRPVSPPEDTRRTSEF